MDFKFSPNCFVDTKRCMENIKKGMNIYNFVYCFFYNYWEKRGTDGRVVASVVLLFTLCIHMFFILEIVHVFGNVEFTYFSSFGSKDRIKTNVTLFSIPLWIIIGLYFNRKRTKRLLIEYNKIYYNNRNNTLRAIFYVVFPFILAITLAIIRQNP